MKKQLLLGALFGCISVSVSFAAVDVWEATERNDFAAVQRYINEGGDVNALDKYDESILHKAAANDRLKIGRLLIENGADINIYSGRDKSKITGETPIHLASASGSLKIVKLLLEHGVKINIKNDEGKTPFGLATTDEMRNLFKEHQEKLKLQLFNVLELE